MGKYYYTIRGWKGLSDKGKTHAVLIYFLSSFFLFFAVKIIFQRRFDLDFSFGNNFLTYVLAFLGAWFITKIAMAYLDKNTYVRNDYFCADCGQFLGNTPTTCKRCGSNRYSDKDSGVGRTVRNR